MFLLFRAANKLFCIPATSFTFQYVSIISLTASTAWSCCLIFTFQYVSIISDIHWDKKCYVPLFTFQYVSIISTDEQYDKFFADSIYIPICFYYFHREAHINIPRKKFTFQYVSIISVQNAGNSDLMNIFTFQYVSIIS